MGEAHVLTLADDALIAGNRWADEIRVEFENGVCIEIGRQAILRQLDAVALDAREADLEGIALGAHGLDLDGLARRLRGSHNRLGREVEGNSEDVRVLN